jgi:hypothetical protein
MSFNGTFADRRSRCPSCRARVSLHGTVELTAGVHYRTLRCISCATTLDDEVPAIPSIARALANVMTSGT